jgi:hypothetical protein
MKEFVLHIALPAIIGSLLGVIPVVKRLFDRWEKAFVELRDRSYQNYIEECFK